MTKRWSVLPTDRPGDTIASCEHQHKHVHGTRAAYTTCGCRCTPCSAAASRAGENVREVDRRSHPLVDPARALAITPDRARAAAVTVCDRVPDSHQARELLDMLGLTHILKEAS